MIATIGPANNKIGLIMLLAGGAFQLMSLTSFSKV